MAEPEYSTNIGNQHRIEGFFEGLGYEVKYLSKGQPASSFEPEYRNEDGQKIVGFEVPGFEPRDLEGKALEEWQELPIEVVVASPDLMETFENVCKGVKWVW